MKDARQHGQRPTTVFPEARIQILEQANQQWIFEKILMLIAQKYLVSLTPLSRSGWLLDNSRVTGNVVPKLQQPCVMSSKKPSPLVLVQESKSLPFSFFLEISTFADQDLCYASVQSHIQFSYGI